ncbi:MAG TPA: DUF349 domain-containing protein [Candidatus Coprenecus stercoravium]|uniref:DUF349 domain-containing protein n=1 Tax=Candidatus Coprenecus stercoravium TaxID=2840735 RepID=A0A9D2GRL3_9BACT|nr:DUF349 domain-containing protein [Candidatus Coprenecus stercoravium]
MIDETLNPSVEKSTAENSVENPETTDVNVNENVNEEESRAEELKGAVISDEELKKLSSKSLKEIVDAFRKLVEDGDIMELNRQAEYIKATFYKVLKEEKIASGYHVQPGSAEYAEAPQENDAAEVEETLQEPEENQEVSVNPFIEIERAFKDLYTNYKARRAVYFQNLEREKQANLEKKLEIIEDLKKLIENTEDINRTFPEFRALQARWRETGPVPQAMVKDVYDTYQHNVENFYDLVKINNELRDLDFKKNLEIKTGLCEKAEALEKSANAVEAFNQLQKLHEEWKECGPVAKEFRDEIWERFRAATSVINKMHQAYFEGLKVQQKENLVAKTALCEKAEALADKEIKESNGWNAVTKEFEEIQKEWRKIGFASKKDNQKIYDRFRAACDKFYNRKREFYSDFKEQMNANMEKKIALCEQAEAVMDSTDWKTTSDYLISLQKQWKEIGPVSRKKSDQIWARFRAACDHFFDNKDKNFGGVDPKYVDNLKAKQAVIDEVAAYVSSGDVREDGKAAREFSDRWNAIGFVPFKEKEKVNEQFRAVMADKFPDFRVSGGGRGKAQRARGGHHDGGPVNQERERLLQKFRKLESEIATYENNIGFFASSKKADSIVSEFQKKIDAAKAELAELEDKIKKLDAQE